MINYANALDLAAKAYIGSTTYFDANIRRELEQDIRRFQSKHPLGSKYLSDSYRGKSAFFRPKTRAMVRSAEASNAESFFATNDVVTISAINERDDFQQAAAEVMQEIVQYRLDAAAKHTDSRQRRHAIPWFQTVQGAFQDAEVQGVVISHQGWNAIADKPEITLIPRENFRFDPAASWLDPVGTSPYLCWMRPMYVKDVRARIKAGRWGNLSADGRRLPISDAEMLAAVQEYDSTRLLRNGDRTSATAEITAIHEYSIVWVYQWVLADDETGEDVEFFTLGTQFLLSQPEPLKDQYAHGMRPFVIGTTVIETHKQDPASPVRLVKDIQAETNEVANQRIDNVKFAMNKRYFVRANRQVDVRALTRHIIGGVVTMLDPEKDVRVVDTPDVTSTAYAEQDRLNMDFDEISGNMSQSSVAANRKLNETVGGMEILSADANKVRSYEIKTFVETWAGPVLCQLVALEQQYETDPELLTYCAGKSRLFQSLGVGATEDVLDQLLSTNLKVTVNLGMAAASPTQKINNLLTGLGGVKSALGDGTLDKYNVDATEVIKEIFGALGHKDGGRFFRDSAETDPRIAQLQQQVEALQQQLALRESPELTAARVKEANARAEFLAAQTTGKKVEAMFGATNAASQIAMNPTIAQPADALLLSAGFVDANAAPIVPEVPEGIPVSPIHENTSPNFPPRLPSSSAGMDDGIESGKLPLA